jgi:basic membrane lipoprotein Med (substrate-binding protein (PBP1-ABC) superfamily)
MLFIPAIAQAENPKTEVFTVLFLQAESKTDLGWNYRHYEELLITLNTLGKIVESEDLYYKVQRNDGKFLQVYIIEKCGYDENSITETTRKGIMQDKPDMVIGTWFNSAKAMASLAEEYPDIKFVHISGYPFVTSNGKNFSTAFLRMEWADYVMGYIVGLLGHTDDIGIVATYLIPEPVRGINGFILGVQAGVKELGKDTKGVLVVSNLVNSWLDAQKEQLAANDLLGAGKKVIRQMSDTPYSSLTACSYGDPEVIAVGYGSDAQKLASCEIGANEWAWSVLYTEQISDAMSGRWKSEDVWWGFPEKALRIVYNKDKLPVDVIAKSDNMIAAMTDGTFNPFCGPLTGKGIDKDGKDILIEVPEGKCLSDMDQLTMQWLVDGYSGEYPVLPEGFKLELVGAK